MVLNLLSVAGLSFTGTANAMDYFLQQGKIDRAPTPETCIQWEARVGLYKLTRERSPASDCVWICDHFVCHGPYKCLVSLCARMSQLEEKNDLTLSYNDTEALALVPMKKSNGELCNIEFEKMLAKSHNIPPLAIVQDKGSDLVCAAKKFSENHPGVIVLYDVVHMCAKALEHRLAPDQIWQRFTKECNKFKREVHLSDCADIAPPRQRGDARYHNVDILIDYAEILNRQDLTPKEKNKLRWLDKYRDTLVDWKGLMVAVKIARDFVRKNGYFRNGESELEDLIYRADIPMTGDNVQFIDNLLLGVQKECEKIPQGIRIIGSSEIVESVNGRLKCILERCPRPMGRTILAAASRMGEPITEKLVAEALEAVSTKALEVWQEESFR